MKASTINKIKSLRVENYKMFASACYQETIISDNNKSSHIITFIVNPNRKGELYPTASIKQIKNWLIDWHNGIENHITETSFEFIEGENGNRRLKVLVTISERKNSRKSKSL